MWLISVVVSFCAGTYLIYEYYIFGDPVSSVTTDILVCPLVNGPLYSVEDYVRANSDVKTFLAEQRKSSAFHKLNPRFIVVPETSGYTVYSSSGLRGTTFPENLYHATLEVMKKSLGEIKAKPMAPDAK